MRILVTGVSGLLGINLAMESSKRHEVYGVFNTNPLVNPLFNCISADLLGKDVFAEVFEQIQPDWVIHCAALANLDDCEDDPAFAEVMNTELPGRSCPGDIRAGGFDPHLNRCGLRRQPGRLYGEEDEPNPLSVYGRTKLAGEWAVMDANPDAIIARVNLFGWSSRGKRSLSEFFFYNMQAGKPVKGFTDVLFCPLLANDLVATLMQMDPAKIVRLIPCGGFQNGQ